VGGMSASSPHTPSLVPASPVTAPKGLPTGSGASRERYIGGGEGEDGGSKLDDGQSLGWKGESTRSSTREEEAAWDVGSLKEYRRKGGEGGAPPSSWRATCWSNALSSAPSAPSRFALGCR
jgi:hypothetical protein